MKSLHVKKGDRVKVIAGNDKGVVGEVIAVDVERQRVTVQGVNVRKRHLRDTARQPQAQSVTKGGIIEREAPIHASNVQPVVGSGKKAQGSRVGYTREEVTKRRPDGSEYTAERSVRYLKKDRKAASSTTDEADEKPTKAAAKSSSKGSKKEADK